jgi:hypothetical protein
MLTNENPASSLGGMEFQGEVTRCQQKGEERAMSVNECKQERFSSRTIGVVFLIVSVLLFVVGMVILPVVGFVFAIPLLILGITMLAAPESKTCRLIREKLGAKG